MYCPRPPHTGDRVGLRNDGGVEGRHWGSGPQEVQASVSG